MKLPEIGDRITTEWALELCDHFKLQYLVERIKRNPEKYKEWKFDGCSMLWDRLAAGVTQVNHTVLTQQCALPHDLCYAYGEPGNKIERERVDLKFKSNLLTKAGMSEFWATIFHLAVRIGGREEFGRSFSWAFARKKGEIKG